MSGIRDVFRPPEVEEAEDIFQEYRKGISETIEKLRGRALERAQQEARELVEKAQDQAREIAGMAQQRADSLMAQANARAEQLVAAAEERISAEARSRVQKEVERLFREAKAESERIMTAARQAAEVTSARVIEDGKKEAEKLAREVMEKAGRDASELMARANEARQRAEMEADLVRRKAAEEIEHTTNQAREEARQQVAREGVQFIEKAKQEAAQILKNAQDQAEKERERLIADYAGQAKKKAELERMRVLFEVRFRAEEVAREVRDRLRAELEKSSMLINGAQQRLGRALEGVADQSLKEMFEVEALPEAGAAGEEGEPAPAAVQLKASGAAGMAEEEEMVFEGKLELEILPPIDFGQKANLEKLLKQIPDLRIVGWGGLSEGTNWMEIELDRPVPLMSFLKQMPPVKQVSAYGNSLVIALKTESEVAEK